MPEINFELPFFPQGLGGNRVGSWRAKMRPAKFYKEDCYEEAFMLQSPFAPKTRLEAYIDFYPPNNRYDLDNMLRGFKNGLDGICKGIKIDDNQIKEMHLRNMGKDKKPRILVKLREIVVSEF